MPMPESVVTSSETTRTYEQALFVALLHTYLNVRCLSGVRCLPVYMTCLSLQSPHHLVPVMSPNINDYTVRIFYVDKIEARCVQSI